jgi:hypothetical protein
VPSSNIGSIPVSGTGFTPGGQVRVEQDAPWGVVATDNVVASEPHTDLVCGYGVHPVCKWVTFPGGTFTALLTSTLPGCGGAVNSTVKATDLSTGAVASEPTTVVYMC